MRDKLELLREWSKFVDVCGWAVDEIDRLQQELDGARAVFRLPTSENSHGPGDVAEEAQVWKDNTEAMLKEDNKRIHELEEFARLFGIFCEDGFVSFSLLTKERLYEVTEKYHEVMGISCSDDPF